MSEPMQPLEARRLYAATAEVRDGVLTVRGTDDADRITVGLNRRGRVLVTIGQGDGEDSAVAFATAVRPRDLDRVQIDGLGGDDVIRLDTLTAPAVVRGGTGDDTVYGGLSGDTLSGDGGNDFISDNRGDDLLDGGAGRDTLRSLRGTDTLLGGSGNDRLLAYADESVLAGGSGTDSATLNGIPDGVSGVEAYAGTYLPAANTRNARGTVSAYENRSGVLMIDTTLNRFGNDFVFDYDLSNADGRFNISATPFVLNPAGPGIAASSVTGSRGIYRRTFAVGLVSGLTPGGFDVTLRSGGTQFYTGNAGFTTVIGGFDDTDDDDNAADDNDTGFGFVNNGNPYPGGTGLYNGLTSPAFGGLNF